MIWHYSGHFIIITGMTWILSSEIGVGAEVTPVRDDEGWGRRPEQLPPIIINHCRSILDSIQVHLFVKV